MEDIKDIKEIESRIYELCSSFIILFEELQSKGIISQEEYDTHTMVKKDFLHRVRNKFYD